jgi:hypothetical protein
MRQGGNVRTFWVATLHGLLELPRIAEEDKIARGLRDSKNIRKGHLGGLIDEQGIDGLGRIGTRPQPRGASAHLTARADRIQELRIVGGALQPRQIRLLFRDFLNAINRRTQLRRCL